MKINLTKEEFKSNFNKLICGLIEGNDISHFYVNKENKSVNIMVCDWNINLKDDGTWEIA